METTPTTDPKVNCSPAGSDFTDSEWSLTFPDEEEKTRMLTPEPTLQCGSQRGSSTSVDDGRYQSFHPNYQFTRDVAPRSSASTYHSRDSRYLGEVIDCHHFDIVGQGPPPIQAVFDTLILGHTSDKSWSSNQSYCLTASSESSASSEFVYLPRPDVSVQSSNFKDKPKIRETFIKRPTNGLKSAKATDHLSLLIDGQPIPSSVPQKNIIDETKENRSIASVESVYVFLESRSDRHRASTLEGLFSDRGLNSSECEDDRLRSTLSKPPSSNSPKRSQIPVKIKPLDQNVVVVGKRITSRGKQTAPKTGTHAALRDSISSAESVYVFQESGSDRQRASTLDGLFSDTEVTSSDYEGGLKVTQLPIAAKFPKRSCIPVKCQHAGNPVNAAKCNYAGESSSNTSSESICVSGDSASDGHRPVTLEGFCSDTEITSSELESGALASARSTPTGGRNSKKRSKIPLRFPPLLPHETFMGKIALICGTDTRKLRDLNREREALLGRTSTEAPHVKKKKQNEQIKKGKVNNKKLSKKAGDVPLKTSFQKRKEYEARRKDGLLNTERKKSPLDEKERDPVMKKPAVVWQQSVETLPSVDVQSKCGQNRNVCPKATGADNLRVNANGMSLLRPKAPDEAKYRHATATEQQKVSLIGKEKRVKHDYSLSDTLGYKVNPDENVNPISFNESGRKNIAGCRKVKNVHRAKDALQPKADQLVPPCIKSKKSPRNTLPPMFKHVETNRFRHDELRGEKNAKVFSNEKGTSVNQENVLYSEKQENQLLSYAHKTQQKSVPCKNVPGSVMVYPRKNVGYVPGYGSVRMYPKDTNPVSSARVELPTQPHFKNARQSGRAKVGLCSVPEPGTKHAEISGSVKLPPIITRQGADNHRGKGKKKHQVNTLELRAKSKLILSNRTSTKEIQCNKKKYLSISLEHIGIEFPWRTPDIFSSFFIRCDRFYDGFEKRRAIAVASRKYRNHKFSKVHRTYTGVYEFPTVLLLISYWEWTSQKTQN